MLRTIEIEERVERTVLGESKEIERKTHEYVGEDLCTVGAQLTVT